MVTRSLAVATRTASHISRYVVSLIPWAGVRATLAWQAFRELNGRKVAATAVGPCVLAGIALAGAVTLSWPHPAVHHRQAAVLAAGETPPGAFLAAPHAAAAVTPAITPTASPSAGPAAAHPAAAATAAVGPPRPTSRPAASPQPPASSTSSSSPVSSPDPSSAPAPQPSPTQTQDPPSAPTGSPQAYAMSLVGSSQYACVDAIFTRESGWRVDAENPNSGAYGIPQALPGSKMASAGADWQTNPITQVRWGIELYMIPRYGSPCGAWAFWQAHGWY